MMVKFRFFLAAILVVLMSCAAMADNKAATLLFKSVNQRLDIMKEVAAAKFVQGDPITITYPERVALRSLFKFIQRQGVNVLSARTFIILQEMLGKQIQQRWFAYWKQKGFPTNTKVFNLQSILRKKLVGMDRQIVMALVSALPSLHNTSNQQAIMEIANKELTNPFLTSKARELIVKSAQKVKLQAVKKN